MDHMVGAYDIAQRLGWRHPELVHHYLNTDPTFPRPVAAIGGPTRKTKVWMWPEVERWARRTGRLSDETAAGES